jgi:glucosylceramidase
MGGSWRSANNLAKNIILDLNNWANGWVFWNLILDQENGPRHAGGLHGSNIVSSDLNTGEITFNPPHYVFGHFSRFIKPGAKRIPCTSNSDDLIATAFINADGAIATVIHNLDDCELMFHLWIEGEAIRSTIPARGTMTIIL